MSYTTPLFTDLYQLTMAEGYFKAGIHRRQACFDYFFRRYPFGGGYALFAGLGNLLEFIENLRVSDSDLDFLRSLGGFDEWFLTHLKTFRFSGDIRAVPEGTPIFPVEPVIRVQAPLEECQLLESALLNIVNYQCLVATKAARICHAAAGKPVLEFGMRRAPGDGAVAASRAAYIGGCSATSNVLAAKIHDIPVKGTQGHAYVLAFESELAAFRLFARNHPTDAVLLLDTYDVLGSGIPNAIAVGKEMQKRGQRLAGVRLDSGDLAPLSLEVRARLDDAGLTDTQIICSGDLDEYAISSLVQGGAPIDAFGVGTRLVTGHGDAHFTGVYKMAAIQSEEVSSWMEPKSKLTEETEKSSLPGVKQTWRALDEKDGYLGDIVEIETREVNPAGPLFAEFPMRHESIVMPKGAHRVAPLLAPVLAKGSGFGDLPLLHQTRIHAQNELGRLAEAARRLREPEPYPVMLGPALHCAASRMANPDSSSDRDAGSPESGCFG